MLTRSVLLAAAATAVSAELFPAHNQVKRALEARQTDVSIPAGAVPTCLQPLISLYGTLPTPPPELMDFSGPKDPCAPFTPPASIASPYSSYTSEVLSWVSEHSAEIESALSNCPIATSMAGPAISSIGGSICTSAPSSGDEDSSSTSSESSAPEETGTDSSSMDHATMSHGATDSTTDAPSATGSSTPTGTAGGAAGTTSQSTAGAFAARETGLAGAAMAAAGFLGVVAML